MSDPSRPTERHPVVTGVIALVAVGLAVGLVLGVAAFAGARFAGLGDGGSASGGESSGGGDTMVLPKPQATEADPDPLITLAPGAESPSSEEPSDEPSEEEKDEKEISLSVGQESVGVFGQIDFTGAYPGGDGRVLQVERFEGGSWVEFNATVAVVNGSFSTFVQSGQSGPNRFRVVDSSDGTTSNPVSVQVTG